MGFDEFLSLFSVSKMGKKRSISLDADACDVQKDWEHAVCPICMEHPHNAVLLMCSFHKKGCGSYICDTSYRHSNCFDRFKKLETDASNTLPEGPPPISLQGLNDSSALQFSSLFGNGSPENRGSSSRIERNVSVGQDTGEFDIQRGAFGQENYALLNNQPEVSAKSSLKCPLCRGDVVGWMVVEESRKHLNLKPRSCSQESCTFVGNYHELRRHARSVHPRVRPAEVDPSRQLAWRHLEHQRERDDVVSAIHSAMPGAMVLGDYVLENSEGLPVERETTSSGTTGSLWSTFFLFEMLESMQSFTGPRRMRGRRPFRGSSLQLHLSEENPLALQDEENDDDDDVEELNLHADVSTQDLLPVRRQRRRLTQSRRSRDRL